MGLCSYLITNVLDMGTELKNGAGMLDLAWLSSSTFLACGYDTFTRLWDTRCRTYVRSWEEPFDESVYCLATDKVNCLVTGTSRHGRVSENSENLNNTSRGGINGGTKELCFQMKFSLRKIFQEHKLSNLINH
jgi:WD40 repeat protein